MSRFCENAYIFISMCVRLIGGGLVEASENLRRGNKISKSITHCVCNLISVVVEG